MSEKQGDNVISIEGRDIAGNIYTDTSAIINIDTVAPPAPVIQTINNTVKWDAVDDSSGIAGYIIHRSTDIDTGYNIIAELYPYTVFADTALQLQTNYYYKVSAVDRGYPVKNESNYSNIDTIIVGSSPPMPVIYKIQSEQGYTNDRNIQLQLEADSTAYEMIISDDCNFQGSLWKPYSTVEYIELSEGDGYKIIYIKFRNKDLIESSMLIDSVVLNELPPAAPLINTEYNEAMKSVTVQWNSVEDTEIIFGYNIYKKAEEDADFKKIFNLYNSTIFIDTNILYGKTYIYKVTAVDSSTYYYESSGSNRVSVYISDTLPPACPVLNLTGIGNQVKLYWSEVNDSSGICGYIIYRSEFNRMNYEEISAAKGLIYYDTQLEIGKTYYYAVKAMDNGVPEKNISVYSNDKSYYVSDISPIPISFVINNGETLTNKYEVELSINAGDTPYEMIISENEAFVGTIWRPYQNKYSYYLSFGDCRKTIYIKYRNIDLVESIISDSNFIYLDTVGPKGTINFDSCVKNGIYKLILSTDEVICETPQINMTIDDIKKEIKLCRSGDTWYCNILIDATLLSGQAKFEYKGKDGAGNEDTDILCGETFFIDTTNDPSIDREIYLLDGTVIKVPANTISTRYAVHIDLTREAVSFSNNADNGSIEPIATSFRDFNIYRDTGREKINDFNDILTIGIPYKDGGNDGLVDGTDIYEKDLKIYHYNNYSNIWEFEKTYWIDTVNNIIYAEVNHLSAFCIMKLVKALNLESTINYPNPFNLNIEQFTTIDTMSPRQNMRVSIFNLVGDIIRELDAVGIEVYPSQGKAEWDGKNENDEYVSAGIYYYIVKTDDGSQVKRLTVIK